MDAPFPEGMQEDITTFFQEVHPRLERWKDVYQEVFNTNLFFPLQRQKELAWMMQQARRINPVTVMEIGADKGGGLYHWCQCLPSVKQVIACEIRGTPYARLFEQAFPHIRFCWLEGSSRGATNLDRVVNWLGNGPGIDCLFIDGDKSAFFEDFTAYRHLLNKQSVVFLHDIQDGPPFDALRRLARLYRTSWYINTADTTEALIRMEQHIPPRTPHEAWLRHWRGKSCGVGAVWLDGDT